jgi:ferredoxin
VIVAERKPLEQILEAVGPAERILLAGCGTCVAVCMAGGEREVAVLASELRMALSLRGRELETAEVTPLRQCDPELLGELEQRAGEVDLVLSMACGAGVQMVAERLAPRRVVPALDTRFLGVTEEPGYWAEYCQACGDCLLDLTGGICPVARCSKGMLNGPCGGSVGGRCEIDPDLPCAWQLIHDRLAAQGRLHLLRRVLPARDWRPSGHGGPRRQRRGEVGP